MKKWMKAASISLASVVALAACGQGGGSSDDSGSDNAGGDNNGESSDFTAKMVTDLSGIDDKSFNEFSWEGLKAFGEANGLEEGTNFDFVSSSSEADFEPNLRSLAREGTDISWAIGFLMENAVKTVAEQFEDANIAIIDTVVPDFDNVASITFKEHEGSFLVGVAAAMQTQTDKVGFIGGVESELIKKFENGFKAGVHAVNPDAEVVVQYAETFIDPQAGAQIANTLYTTGSDVIYHAAGNAGNGLFTEAINRVKNGEDVWAIGVDKDQYEEGVYDGEESVTLTSMIKRVDIAVQDVSEMTLEGSFPGGEVLEYGIEDEGIDYAKTGDNLSPEMIEAMDDYMQQILDGEIDVPQTDDEFDEWAE